MTLTLEQVRHVAELARLSLSTEEERLYQGQLSAILDAMEALRELPTEGIEPTAHAMGSVAPLRADEVLPSLEVEQALANAPARAGTGFAVPRVLE